MPPLADPVDRLFSTDDRNAASGDTNAKSIPRSCARGQPLSRRFSGLKWIATTIARTNGMNRPVFRAFEMTNIFRCPGSVECATIDVERIMPVPIPWG
jgi:hypothetical protein